LQGELADDDLAKIRNKFPPFDNSFRDSGAKLVGVELDSKIITLLDLAKEKLVS
jgi:hypothetical protein